MNSPIKPPGAGAPLVGATPIDQVGEHGTEALPLDGAGAHPNSLGSVLADLQAGRTTPEAAIERIISATVDAHGGVAAEAGVREELVESIRQTFAEDPTLRDLVSDLEQDFSL